MTNKLFLSLILISFILSLVIFTGTADARILMNNANVNVNLNAPVNTTCMQNAIEARDTAIINAMTVRNSAIVNATTVRKNELKTAWTVVGFTQRISALKDAWKKWAAAKAVAKKTFKQSQNTAWTKYHSDRKACGITKNQDITQE